MRNSPWTTLAAGLKKVSDRIDAQPTVREATLVSDSEVRFDIDSQNTTVHGTLAPGLPAGTRVLTITLKHYVWILGGRDKAPLSVPIASETTAGIVELATAAEVQAGTDSTRAVTPATLATWENRKRMVVVGNSNATALRPSSSTAWSVLLAARLGLIQHNFALDSQSFTTSATKYITLAQNGIGAMTAQQKAETGLVFVVDASSDARANVSYATLYPAAKTLFNYIRAQIPHAKIVVVPHVWPADSKYYTPGTWNPAIPSAVLNTARALQDALSEYSNTLYMDHSWTWLTGRDDLMIGVNDVHPNVAGHAYLANLIERCLDGETIITRQEWTAIPLAANFAPHASESATAEFRARARMIQVSRVGWDVTVDGFIQRNNSNTSGAYYDISGPSSTGMPRPFQPPFAVAGTAHKMLSGGGIGASVPIEFWSNGYIRCYGGLAIGEGVLISAQYQLG